jgi:hypothetical protein
MVQLGLLLGKGNKNFGDTLFSAGNIASTSVEITLIRISGLFNSGKYVQTKQIHC